MVLRFGDEARQCKNVFRISFAQFTRRKFESYTYIVFASETRCTITAWYDLLMGRAIFFLIYLNRKYGKREKKNILET